MDKGQGRHWYVEQQKNLTRQQTLLIIIIYQHRKQNHHHNQQQQQLQNVMKLITFWILVNINMGWNFEMPLVLVKRCR